MRERLEGLVQTYQGPVRQTVTNELAVMLEKSTADKDRLRSLKQALALPDSDGAALRTAMGKAFTLLFDAVKASYFSFAENRY